MGIGPTTGPDRDVPIPAHSCAARWDRLTGSQRVAGVVWQLLRHFAVSRATIILWMLAAGVAGGCFLPPSLEPETEADAAPNSIPVIIDSTFQATGPLTIRKDVQEPVTLTVRDLDTSDTVYVYFYVDYGLPETGPPLNGCAGAGGNVDRTLSCELNSLCNRIPLPDTQVHFLEALVADRERLLAGEPRNRAFPEGTGISYRAWLMSCTE